MNRLALLRRSLRTLRPLRPPAGARARASTPIRHGLGGLLSALAMLGAAPFPAQAAAPAAAAEPDSCRSVRLASPGWADIDATNAVAQDLLKALGYEVRVQNLSVPLTYQGLRSGQVDAFLGNWLPAQQALVEPLLQKGQVERLATNLAGARFTLAVSADAADAGIRSLGDLAAQADKFGRRLYGIEAGAPANQILRQMIAANAAGLGGWQLVESSDAGLLAQLAHEQAAHRPMLFLAWEPHVMNTRFRIRYLEGTEAWFGPGGGAATVNTVARSGWRAQCPNAARLLSQLSFSVAFENGLIRDHVDQHLSPDLAARRALATPAGRQLAATWLAGVRTRQGDDGFAAWQRTLTP